MAISTSPAFADSSHPERVLHGEGGALPAIPCVDHYAGSEKLISKSLAKQSELGPVFDITCDCEDGAPIGQEAAHARILGEIIASDTNRFERLGARIHPLTHPAWLADMRTLVGAAGHKLAYITLPKARHLADVRLALSALRQTEQEHAVTRQIPMHVLIETHGALREVRQIAALPGVASLDFGLMDFVSEHAGAISDANMHSPGQFEHPLLARAKAEIAAAALANGCMPTHNVCTQVARPEEAGLDARRAREAFGFLRMWSIHPAQIEPILQALRPEREEVEKAADILLAAQSNNWGPIKHQDRLHDRASFRYYWSLLKRAQQSGASLPAEAHARFFAR